MDDGSQKVGNILTTEEKRNVALRARLVCEYNGTDVTVFEKVGLVRAILTQLELGTRSFSRNELGNLAKAIGVYPAFLLEKGVPTNAEMEEALSSFERAPGQQQKEMQRRR